MKDKVEYEISSGNVFEDIGLPNSQEMFAKAEIALEIIDIAEKRHLTHKELALFLKIDQSKVSDLYHGRLTGFSIVRLIKFLELFDGYQIR